MGTVRYTVIDGEIVSEVRDGVRRDYVPDSLGNTIALTDGTSFTDTWEYWPYGEVRSRTGTTATPFQFVGTLGYYTDSANSRIYVRARTYRQGLGRWQTVDPLWPWRAAYRYAKNRPQQGFDPSGKQERIKRPMPSDCVHDCDDLVDRDGSNLIQDPCDNACNVEYHDDLDDCEKAYKECRKWWWWVPFYCNSQYTICLHRSRVDLMRCQLCCNNEGDDWIRQCFCCDEDTPPGLRSGPQPGIHACEADE